MVSYLPTFFPNPISRKLPLGLIFTVSFFFIFFVFSRPVLAACVVTVPLSQCTLEDVHDQCSSDQTLCPGSDDVTGDYCTACVSTSTPTSQTCSNDPDITADDNCPWQNYSDNYSTGLRCVSGATCTGVYSDQCRYCVAPVCNYDNKINNGETGLNCGGGGCPACAALSCAVTSATPTSSTTADATSDDTGGDLSGYDRVDWFLNGGYIGATTINTTNGTSSNTFTNLVAGTQYNLGAHYVDTEGGRPAVSCSGYTFQFNPPSTQTTCSLSVSPQSIEEGGSAQWSIANDPAGATAAWGGTNPDGSTVSGPVQGYSNATSWSQTYTYNTSGGYSRYVNIYNSSGALVCTTDTVSLYVNPQSCSSNPISVSPTSFV